jgi:hypothetical protein
VTFIIAKRAFRAETQNTSIDIRRTDQATPFEVSLGDRMIETVGIVKNSCRAALVFLSAGIVVTAADNMK